MSVRPELLQISLPKILEALGRASGIPIGLVRMDPPELLFSTPELEALLVAKGLPTSGAPAAEWLLRANDRTDGLEVSSAEVATATATWVLVSARPNAKARLKSLTDRLARRFNLSPSEHRELEHLARGLAIKDSAKVLGLSPETVRVRRKRVYRKMGLTGHEQLLARLCQEALALPDGDSSSRG
jgi:DNA-binding CsgD family transcriptional regulator